MEEGQGPRALAIAPVREEAEAAEKEGGRRREGDENRDGEDDDFEFVFVCDDPDAASPADEIFYDGKILPVYPVSGSDIFLRPSWFCKNEEVEEKSVRNGLGNLLLVERERERVKERESERVKEMNPSCSSSESDELDGIPEESYCVWTPGSVPPSPDMKKKSKSTGSSATSSSRRWSLRDLVVRRSHSDGKKNFVFVTPMPKAEAPTAMGSSNSVESGESRKTSVESRESGRKSPGRSVEKSTRGQMYYMKRGEAAAAAVRGDHRRSYLPYRKDIFGIFAGANGMGRAFHPF